MDEQAILQRFGTNGLKQVWLGNPKSPFVNHFGGNAPGFKFVEGVVDGARVFRATVIAHEARNIIGVGDASIKKEAEKLASLSALIQLVQAGLVSRDYPM
jgi:hypothetical protein